MGDYYIIVLNKNEQDCLETILIPYCLYVMHKELPTRVVRTSKTLIDYIIRIILMLKRLKPMCRIHVFIHQKTDPLISK